MSDSWLGHSPNHFLLHFIRSLKVWWGGFSVDLQGKVLAGGGFCVAEFDLVPLV